MPSLGTLTLVGKSGKAYRFMAYPLGTIFKEGFAAVYVITQRTLKVATGKIGRHTPLFFGHGANLGQPTVDATGTHDTAANCICVHAERDEKERLGIQQDLIGQSDHHKTW